MKNLFSVREFPKFQLAERFKQFFAIVKGFRNSGTGEKI